MRYSNTGLFLVASISILSVHGLSPPSDTPRHLKRATLCTPGTFSSNGFATCTPCSPGSYSSNYGATSCTPARPGYHVTDPGSSSESPCLAGTYSTGGAVTCSDCPPGYKCPSNALSNPQPCSPGTYSTGGKVISCTQCRAGTFNSVQGATSCCLCCAGWYNANPGLTNCQKCPNSNTVQQGSSAPGTNSVSGCSRTVELISNSCSQNSNTRTCPAGSGPSNIPRSVVKRAWCAQGVKVCPVFGYRSGKSTLAPIGHECIDIRNDLESCGGCVPPDTAPGTLSVDGGRDCSSIPHVNSVQCKARRCVIHSCRSGYILASDGASCVPEVAMYGMAPGASS